MSEYGDEFLIEDLDEYRLEDAHFKQAIENILNLYEEDKRSVFFTRQLQVQLENKYFHWITDDALRYLYRTEKLKLIKEKISEEIPLHFYVHPSNRYPKRDIQKKKKVILEYSSDLITRSCGHRAEIMFSSSIMMRGFRLVGKNVNEFKNKKWKKSGHNLDYIFEKDGIFYGCEIKNSLGYIDKNELEIKLEMCKYLDITPLLILRYSPKPYNKEIIDRGGFVLIFKYQLYEVSQKPLVDKIKSLLKLPVDCPVALYEGTITRFENWHKKRVNSKKIHKK